MVITGGVREIFTINQIRSNFIDKTEQMFYNPNQRIKKRGAGTMATENQVEWMKEEKEVSGKRENIQKLAVYIGNKKSPKSITCALHRLASEICVQEINQSHAKL